MSRKSLSWYTVLKKRAHYRIAFENFEPERIAGFDQAKRGKVLSGNYS
jgi:DNA-3-methyladenine glycosylase I